MSKTRRNIGANRRHVKGDYTPENTDHRIDRFTKKMEKTKSSKSTFDEDFQDKKISHKNYEQFLEENVEEYDDEEFYEDDDILIS